MEKYVLGTVRIIIYFTSLLSFQILFPPCSHSTLTESWTFQASHVWPSLVFSLALLTMGENMDPAEPFMKTWHWKGLKTWGLISQPVDRSGNGSHWFRASHFSPSLRFQDPPSSVFCRKGTWGAKNAGCSHTCSLHGFSQPLWHKLS